MKLRKTALAALILVLAVLLYGCGAQISTELKISGDFSGQRVIRCVASKSDVSSNFQGGVEKIDSILAASCPAELAHAKSEDESNYIYTFTLDFSSLEDYRAKVEKIIGREPVINFAKPDSVFASGVSIEEDFDSTELLGWFKAVVEQESLISDSSNLWEIAETKVSFDGAEYSTGGTVYVNDITYNPLDRITVDTQLSPDGTFQRTVRFIIPGTTYEAKSAEIEAFMESLTPSGGSGEWSDDAGGGRTFTVQYEAADAQELSQKTAAVLDSGSCSFQSEGTAGDNPLSEYTAFSENLDFTAFASDSQSEVNVEYRFEAPQTDVLYSDGSTGAAQENLFEGSFHTGSLVLNFTAEHAYPVESVGVETEVISAEQVKRSTVLTYASDGGEEGAARARQYFESLGAAGLSVDTPDGGAPVCRITVQGTADEVGAALSAAFSAPNTVFYQAEKKGLAKIDGNFTETVDLTDFLARIRYDGAVQYSLKAAKGEKIRELTVQDGLSGSTDTVSDPGGTYSARIPATASITYEGTTITILGVLLTVLCWLLALAALATGMLLLIRWLAARDGISEKSRKELLVHYAKIALQKIRAAGIRLKTFLAGLGDLFLPENARIPMIRYFYGSKWPILLVLCSILGLPALLGRLLVRLSGGGPSLLPVLLTAAALLAALIIRLCERFGTSAEKERAADEYVQSDLEYFRERALSRLGLVEEQISLISPIRVTGPYCGLEEPDAKRSVFGKLLDFIKYLFVYRTRLIFKYGSDQKTRYSVVQASIFLYSESQIYVYKAGYDLCTGEIFAESTSEYFYRNVSCILSGERDERIRTGRKTIHKKYEYFKVITASGAVNHAVVDGGGQILQNQIMAMKNLVRDKKQKRTTAT